MDKGTATLVVGLLAGFIGLFSAILSHLSLRYQLRKQSEESVQTRIHNLKLQGQPKRLEAVEEIWLLLVKFETNYDVSDSQKDSYIRATLWLPEDARALSLTLLKYLGDASKVKKIIGEIRKNLIEITNDYL